MRGRVKFFGATNAAIQELHSYETPEIIALPISTGDAAYLDWARQATERKDF